MAEAGILSELGWKHGAGLCHLTDLCLHANEKHRDRRCSCPATGKVRTDLHKARKATAQSFTKKYWYIIIRKALSVLVCDAYPEGRRNKIFFGRRVACGGVSFCGLSPEAPTQRLEARTTLDYLRSIDISTFTQGYAYQPSQSHSDVKVLFSLIEFRVFHFRPLIVPALRGAA